MKYNKYKNKYNLLKKKGGGISLLLGINPKFLGYTAPLTISTLIDVIKKKFNNSINLCWNKNNEINLYKIIRIYK